MPRACAAFAILPSPLMVLRHTALLSFLRRPLAAPTMALLARTSNSPPPKRARQASLSLGGGSAAGTSSSLQNGTDSQSGRQRSGPGDKEQRALEKRQNSRVKAKKKDRLKALDKTGEEPVFFDICDLLGAEVVQAMLAAGPKVEWADKFRKGEEVSLVISRISAHGDGLAVAPSGDWIVAVPHCLPGERVLAKVFSNERLHSKADLIRVEEVPPEGSQRVSRREELVGCKYFGKCAGCQYQMIDYEMQLDLKRTVVSRAFANYSMLDEALLPVVLPTLPSPLQYRYRTKLTPHFELPPSIRRQRRAGPQSAGVGLAAPVLEGEVSIGLNKLGGKSVLDIEECPIATRTINAALPAERERVRRTIGTFKNGATLLLRDSLISFDSHAEDRNVDIAPETETITDHKAVVKERVGNVKFDSPAGAFFQNNRSILPSLLAYVQEQVIELTDREQDNYLVDAYCGSGLFAISLAKLFKMVAGVEISQDSIRYAKQNVALNGVDNVDFIAGDAQEIFKVRDEQGKCWVKGQHGAAH